MLADLGADVVKIENPNGGDDTRGWGPPFIEDETGKRSRGPYFACCNRNKRSVSLDFKRAEDVQMVRDLAKGRYSGGKF